MCRPDDYPPYPETDAGIEARSRLIERQGFPSEADMQAGMPGQVRGTEPPPFLAYGHHRVTPTYDHEAGWGARLIFREVMDGSTGIVYDRQSTFGRDALVETYITPVFLRWLVEARRAFHDPEGEGSNEAVTLVHDRVTVVGSPQRSYGYLYVTALLLREGVL